jgi:hypothetical protein
MSILTAEPVEEYSYKPEVVYELEKSGKRIIDIVTTKNKKILNSWVTFFKSKDCPIFATKGNAPKYRISLWIKETINTNKKSGKR